MPQPNILYIHSHDTGRYIQPYGHAVETPHLQALAEEGMLFRQCHCANPTCSASRAALVTGQYPHQNGMFGLAHIGWSLNDYGKHLLHTLKTAGYISALSGIQHIISHDRTPEIGYDEWLNPQGPQPHEAAAAWLDKKPSKPFFLAVGFGETHREFPEDHPQDDTRYTLPPAPLPDTPEVREDMARYKASARILDERMGAVFEALKRNGQWENTLVICTTDHGIAFPRMKCNLTDSGTGVMLILCGPGGFTGGKVSDALVSHVDLFPTVCDLAGVDRPAWLEGTSLLPLAADPASAVRDEVHAEVNYHVCWEPMRMVRTRRWKYIKRFSDREKPVLPNTDDGLSKSLCLDAGWFEPQDEALYDMILDPNEAHNLAGDPARASVLADMRQRMQLWQESTADPILDGPIPPCEGAVFSDIDGTTPNDKKKPFAENPQY